MTSAEKRDILDANAAFYAAFEKHDANAMDAVWAREADVACLHPGWPPLLGRERVLASWRALFEQGGAPSISCSGPSVHGLGHDAAYVICTEHIPGGVLVATNLFVREHGQFRMVHHQASPLPRGTRAPPAPPKRGLN